MSDATAMKTEAGFPDSHTTETQVQEQPTKIYMDLTVVRTNYGYIKIVEMVFDLLGFICVVSSGFNYHSRGSWFNTVAMVGFWYSAIVLALYVFHIPQKLSKIPWKKAEFVFCVIWTFFYLIAASLAANFGYDEALAAAAFFGFVAMVAYGADAWFSFTHIKHIVVVKTTTSTAATPTQY